VLRWCAAVPPRCIVGDRILFFNMHLAPGLDHVLDVVGQRNIEAECPGRQPQANLGVAGEVDDIGDTLEVAGLEALLA
jgi:hypothetical protein